MLLFYEKAIVKPQNINYFKNQKMILIKKWLSKLNLTFLFISFCSYIKNIGTNTVFKNECSQFKNNVLEYFSLC